MRRTGYTLIELLVTLALLVVLAGILLPVLTRERTADRVGRADRELKALTDALDAFAEDVQEWPANLNQLVVPLVAGDQDICGANYVGGERDGWAGPYLDRPVPAAGLPIGIGTVAPTFTLVGGTGVDFLQLTISGVEEGDALALDQRVDNDDDPAAGTVRWTAAGNGQATITWVVPIHEC